MLIKNARLRGKDGFWQIRFNDGVITKISREELNEEDQVIDAAEGMVVPPFVESHCHIDCALTAGGQNRNLSGTLFEGIERWGEIKQSLTENDVKERAIKVLNWQIVQGVQFVRTHVDVSDPNLTALKAMLEIKEKMAPWVTLQLVAFPQVGVLSGSKNLELIEEALRMGADLVGAIPHVELTREDSVESIKQVFQLAEKYDRMIDVHCDETDDDQARGIEVVAAEAYRREMGHLVTASHTTAMGSYNDAYAFKLFGLLKKANIHFVANPLVNIHLQGRYDSYPKRRGLTRVKELLEAGLNVSFGHDDIIDPFYPLGTTSMLQVLHMGVHVCHLTGYEQMSQSLDLVSTNAAKVLQITEKYGIEEGKPANLIILPAVDDYDAIRRQVPVRLSIREGNIISETKPAESVIFLGDKKKVVDFNL